MEAFIVTVVVVVVSIMTVFFLVKNKVDSNDLQELHAQGVPTQAAIIEVRDYRMVTGAKAQMFEDDGTQLYYVDYAYEATDQDGTTQHLTHTETISEASYKQLSAGQRIQVQYLRSKPTFVRIIRSALPGE